MRLRRCLCQGSAAVHVKMRFASRVLVTEVPSMLVWQLRHSAIGTMTIAGGIRHQVIQVTAEDENPDIMMT